MLGQSNRATGILYCNDISAEFDRVLRRWLAEKLQRLWLHPHLQQFLKSWLADRVAEVVVGGRSAGQEPPTDSVLKDLLQRRI